MADTKFDLRNPSRLHNDGEAVYAAAAKLADARNAYYRTRDDDTYETFHNAMADLVERAASFDLVARILDKRKTEPQQRATAYPRSNPLGNDRTGNRT